MTKSKYRPDYHALYPGVHLSDEVLSVLKKSDRKMEYQQCDIKREHCQVDQIRQTVTYTSSREDSYERLLEENKQFRQAGESVEDSAVKAVLIEQMMDCFMLLDREDQELLRALVFEQVTQRELAEVYKISQPAIKKRQDRALARLKKLMEK